MVIEMIGGGGNDWCDVDDARDAVNDDKRQRRWSIMIASNVNDNGRWR